MNFITPENWTYCRFKSESFMAFISFGADPEGILKDQLDYFVTVLKDEDTEIFQEKFNSLSKACLFINTKYQDWEFEDQTVKKSGCSTCAAH